MNIVEPFLAGSFFGTHRARILFKPLQSGLCSRFSFEIASTGEQWLPNQNVIPFDPDGLRTGFPLKMDDTPLNLPGTEDHGGAMAVTARTFQHT